MTSKEVELELKLEQLNNKIKFYSKFLRYPFFKILMLKRYVKVIEKRNDCFKELREMIRKKYPEKFIGGNYGK